MIMAAPKLTSKQRKQTLDHMNARKPKKQSKPKSVLCTPYIVQWPKIEKELEEIILNKLVDNCSIIDLKRPVINKKLKREERKAELESCYNSRSKEEISARKQLVCGINEVTKCLEKDELRLLLVNKSSNVLTQHLIQLAGVRKCTALIIDNLDQSIAPLISTTQLSCLGFRKLNSIDENPVLNEFISFVTSSVPKIELPWLDFEESLAEFAQTTEDFPNTNDENITDNADRDDRDECKHVPKVTENMSDINFMKIDELSDSEDSTGSEENQETVDTDHKKIKKNVEQDFLAFDEDLSEKSIIEMISVKRKFETRVGLMNKMIKTEIMAEVKKVSSYKPASLHKMHPNQQRKSKKKQN